MNLSPSATASVVLALIVAAMVLNSVYVFALRWNINATAFLAQIQKLIMANNIDRAIKLCNAEPRALLPRAVKALLTRANRPYSLYLAQEEALLELRTITHTHRSLGVVSLIFGLVVLGLLELILQTGLEGQVLDTVKWSGIATAGMLLLGWLNQVRLVRHMTHIEMALTRTRNLLYARSNYKPPQYEPIEMTDEEIAQWRRSMDYVEGEAVKVGPGTAADLHDGMVNKTNGVLPPL